MQSQSDELKYSDDDIRQLREAVAHLLEINDELNTKVITMNTWVKNGDAKIKVLSNYITRLEHLLKTKPNDTGNQYPIT